MPLAAVPTYVAEVPSFEPRGDSIYIEWRGLEIYVPIPVVRAALGRCNRAMDEWHEDKGLVAQIKPLSAVKD